MISNSTSSSRSARVPQKSAFRRVRNDIRQCTSLPDCGVGEAGKPTRDDDLRHQGRNQRPEVVLHRQRMNRSHVGALTGAKR